MAKRTSRQAYEPAARWCKCGCCQQFPIEEFERNRGSDRPDGSVANIKRRSWSIECREREKPFADKAIGKAAYLKKNPRPKIGTLFQCPCCGTHIMVEDNREVALQHNHKTGKMAGWVCAACNTASGKFRDNPALMVDAAYYHAKTFGLSPEQIQKLGWSMNKLIAEMDSRKE